MLFEEGRQAESHRVDLEKQKCNRGTDTTLSDFPDLHRVGQLREATLPVISCLACKLWSCWKWDGHLWQTPSGFHSSLPQESPTRCPDPWECQWCPDSPESANKEKKRLPNPIYGTPQCSCCSGFMVSTDLQIVLPDTQTDPRAVWMVQNLGSWTSDAAALDTDPAKLSSPKLHLASLT